MNGMRKSILVVAGGALILALIMGGVVFYSTSVASAEEAPSRSALAKQAEVALSVTGKDGFGHPGGPGFPGRAGKDGTYLAEALDITVEELGAAQQAAREAAIDLALEQGLVTEEQAEAMKAGERGFMGKGFPRGGFRGPDNGIDHQALLADELGITVDELQAAMQEAGDAAIAAALESGDLTQEQVDSMTARRALMDYIDPEALAAKALGITVEELQAAREDGKSMRDLMEDLEISFEDFKAEMQAAHQAAIEQAVEDGVITPEQAEQLQSKQPGFGGRGHGRFGPGGCERGGPGGFNRPGMPNTETSGSDL